jgi:AAA15 family ATPase/GTPase
MKISALNLYNFKRFTELHIQQIPEESKLVLIIGSNGSGKSSVFDAFDFLQKGHFKGVPYGGQQDSLNYYRKFKESATLVEIIPHTDPPIIKEDWQISTGQEVSKKFIGRSSIKIVSRIKNNANPNVLADDSDSPITFIENDERFTTDVFLYIQSINKALREPIFSGKQADTLKIFQEFIEPFNTSLKNIFGSNPQTTIKIAEFEDASPQAPAKLIFQKGDSKVNYDFLSHGEKQVVILLLNFIVRREYYKDAIIFIDEMDVHLNTKLQYNTLKEITEKWIPDNSQLWTASHALGFIDYANDFEKGVILDFDDLDFDKAQTIIPSPKNRLQIFELAVSKDFLDRVFQNKVIYFSEQTDAPIYNDLNFEDILFFDGKDKLGAFYKAKELDMKAIIDRDYLTDEEMKALKEVYPFLHFTPYYNIETVYYHPDNVEEYYKNQHIPFDKEAYIAEITKETHEQLAYISAGVAKARDGYPFYKENGNDARLKTFKANTNSIIDMLKSSEFETFYKVFNAKEYGKNIAARQNINPIELTKTNWFKSQIQDAIQ